MRAPKRMNLKPPLKCFLLAMIRRPCFCQRRNLALASSSLRTGLRVFSQWAHSPSDLIVAGCISGLFFLSVATRAEVFGTVWAYVGGDMEEMFMSLSAS